MNNLLNETETTKIMFKVSDFVPLKPHIDDDIFKAFFGKS